MSGRPRHSKLRLVFGRRVREERLKREWSQEYLAELADLTQVYISDIETGKRAVSIDVIEAISGAFKLDAPELISRKSP